MTVPDRAWLARPVLEVARGLLGAQLTTSLADGVVTVRLTEVEAYGGSEDPGSHAARGRTARNAVMFDRGGLLYVYRHLGLHHCVNVVTGAEGSASAVLLRAGEVVHGHGTARARRRRHGVSRADVDLARGPARLAVALGVDLGLGGADLLDEAGPARLTLGAPVEEASTGPRVGVAGMGGDGAVFPWRLWLPGEPTVSAYRPAPQRRGGRS